MLQDNLGNMKGMYKCSYLTRNSLCRLPYKKGRLYLPCTVYIYRHTRSLFLAFNSSKWAAMHLRSSLVLGDPQDPRGAFLTARLHRSFLINKVDSRFYSKSSLIGYKLRPTLLKVHAKITGSFHVTAVIPLILVIVLKVKPAPFQEEVIDPVLHLTLVWFTGQLGQSNQSYDTYMKCTMFLQTVQWLIIILWEICNSGSQEIIKLKMEWQQWVWIPKYQY